MKWIVAVVAPCCLGACSGGKDLKKGTAEIDFSALETAAGDGARDDSWLGYLGTGRDSHAGASQWNADWGEREPERAWRVELGVGVAGVAVADNRVYAVGNQARRDVVRCLNLDSGAEIWKIDYPCSADQSMFEGGPAATPQLDPVNGRLYVLSQEGDLRCLSTRDGGEIWKKRLVEEFGGRRPTYGYAGSPLLAGGLLVVEPGGSGASVVALDAQSGEKRWAAGDDRASYGAPVAFESGGQPAVALFNRHGLVSRLLGDGRELFRVRWETDYDVNAANPVHVAGHFFIISGYGKGGGLFDVRNGSAELVYETDEVVAQFQSPVRVGAQLYLVSGDNKSKARLSCLDIADGKVRWREPLSGNRGSVIVSGARLIATSERGEVVLCEASPERFREIGRFQASGGRVWAQPALVAGRLLVRNNDGRLSCWDLR